MNSTSKKINDLKNSKFARYPGLVPVLEKILCVHSVETILNRMPNTKDLKKLLESIFEQLDIKLHFRQEDVEMIPAKGPVIIVSNHPFGILDGAAIASLAFKVRPDVKLLGNVVLKCSEDFSPLFIGINVYNSNNATTVRGLQETQQWLENGGALSIFPSGTVSHWNWKKWQVTDPDWQQACIKLAIQHKAVIIPMYIHGRNSWYFQLLGMISRHLRTLLLPQQNFAKKHSDFYIAIGKPIYPSELEQQGNIKEQLSYLRRKTYLLKFRPKNSPSEKTDLTANSIIEKPIPNHLLQKDLLSLDSSACLVEHGEYCVYAAAGDEIPNILKEIGRLREITFRKVGEGTGKASDIDQFDPYYSHLFVWQKKEQKIIAAYRLGLSDKILSKLGNEGMYISTLYDSTNEFLSRIQPSVELGRSFIVPEYQKMHSSLFLLWKGIGQFLVKNPQYQNLYGVVSISHTYQKLSRDLIIHFLYQYHTDQDIAATIHPKFPYPLPKKLPNILREENSKTLIHLNSLVSEIEYDHKEIPILIRQYQSLQAKFLGFSLDKNFQNCLDCLIIVKVKDIPKKILIHYFGQDGLASYLNYHNYKNKIHK